MWRRKANLHKNTLCICLLVSCVAPFLFIDHIEYTITMQRTSLHTSVRVSLCWGEHFDILLLQQGGIGACDPRQFSFQPDSYQQDSYQDPSSSSEVQSWINLKSISRSSVTPTGADLRVWHWKDNHLKEKQQYTVYLVRGTKLQRLQFQPSRVVLFS